METSFELLGCFAAMIHRWRDSGMILLLFLFRAPGVCAYPSQAETKDEH